MLPATIFSQIPGEQNYAEGGFLKKNFGFIAITPLFGEVSRKTVYHGFEYNSGNLVGSWLNAREFQRIE